MKYLYWGIAGLAVILIILAALLVSRTVVTDAAPEAALTLTPDKLELRSNQTSDVITVAVTKKDAGDKPATFNIKMTTPNSQMLRFVRENTTINSIQTGVLRRQDDRLSDVFQIYAEKAPGSDSTTWTATFELMYNDTVVDIKEMEIVVK